VAVFVNNTENVRGINGQHARLYPLHFPLKSDNG
jgi:hypothetical protein